MQGYTLEPTGQSVLLVPRPARAKPKAGHWRVSERGKMIPPPSKRGLKIRNALVTGAVEGDITREQIKAKETRRARRARMIAQLKADGHLV